MDGSSIRTDVGQDSTGNELGGFCRANELEGEGENDELLGLSPLLTHQCMAEERPRQCNNICIRMGRDLRFFNEIANHVLPKVFPRLDFSI